MGIAFNGSGILYVADLGNSTIRTVTQSGLVSTLGGDPGETSGADGNGGSALFSNPAGIAVNTGGTLFVADSANNRISTGLLLAATGPASQITSNSATLSGSANPVGLSTTVWFQYGPGTGYGFLTGSQSIGSGSNMVAVTASLPECSAYSSWHYRLVYDNDATGTIYGVDKVFTVTDPAPTATTETASEKTADGATLNATVNPNGHTTNLCFQFGTGLNYGSTSKLLRAGAGKTALHFSARIAGLNPATPYHFRVEAVNSSGSGNGEDQVFTTANEIPSASTAAATSITGEGAIFNGEVNPNGLSTTVFFEYGATRAYGSKTAATTTAAGNSAAFVSSTIATLKPNSPFHYRCVASNHLGTAYGKDQVFTTGGAVPSASTLAATVTGTGVTFNGKVNPNDLSTTVFFQYGATDTYGSKTSATTIAAGDPATSVSSTITTLQAASPFHYRCVATNQLGTAYGDDETLTTAAADDGSGSSSRRPLKR